MADLLVQAIILLCGVSTVFLSTAKTFRVRRNAQIFGMIAQPFWLYDACADQNWGVFILSILFFCRWTQTFIRDWILHKGDVYG